MRQKLLFASVFPVCLFLAIVLSYPVRSGAVTGQIYSGDGAAYNPTVPPGGWLFTQATDGSCLTCHSTGFANAPIKINYLMTGHKNVLRMVPVPPPTYPFALTDPAGQPYSTDLFGDLFSWSDYTVTLQGSCTISAYTDPTNCANGGGVWLSGSKPLYFIEGGWMNAKPAALYDGTYTQGGQKTAVSYSCGRCHTTGFTMDTAIDNRCSFYPGTGIVCRTPEAYFPGITWTPSTTTGKIDLDPDGNGPAVSSSWAVAATTGQSLEGVQCERCHDATYGHTPAIIRKGPAATGLCLQCHRQEHVVSYTTGTTGANIHPTPATDNVSLPASEPLYALPAIEVGRSDGSYAPVFYQYSTGMEYLNSVHGKFTGNFQQINDPARYLSTFVTSSVDGGCTKCHDVHESTVAAVNAAPFKKTCPDCHQEGSTSGLSMMFHPSGPGTPLGDLTNIPAACAKCHMPRPNSGEGRSSHLWRISTDASYTTFPTQTQWDAGQKTALAASAGTYTDAVWIDLDIACGQCHGSAGTAHFFAKAAIAPFASGMHASSSGAASALCLGCHSTAQNGNPAIVVGGNHHGATPGVTKECTECHTRPGTAMTNWQTNEFCRACHTVTAGPYQVADPQHVNSATLFRSCSVCHKAGGYLPSPANDLTCAQCHGGGTSSSNLFPGGAVMPPAPWLSSAQLGAFATTIHTDATATSTPPVVSHGTVTLIAWQVTFAETSYDPDGTIDDVTVSWGDGVVSKGTVSSGTFSHDYPQTTRTYTITHKVVDKVNPNIYAQESFSVNVPQRYTVSGIVTASTGTPLSGAIVTLRLNGNAVKSATTSTPGTFSFTNLLPGGVYTVSAYKAGYTFNVFTIPSLMSNVTITMKAN